MAPVLSVDFESRSTVDLRKTGIYPYVTSPTTEILCMAYAFDDEEPRLWVPPARSGDNHVVYSIGHGRMCEHIEAGLPLRAWNAAFERLMWWGILGPRFGFPVPKREQWYDTMADAAAMGLPLALNRCAMAMGLAQQKDDAGHRLMLKMCKPRKARKGEPKDKVLWHETPEDLQRLYDYCLQDVRVERSIAKRIRPIGPAEREIYLLDQKINDRGVMIDTHLVKGAQKLVAEATSRANAELETLTNGELTKVTKVADLTQWLQASGLPIDNVAKDTLRDLLEGEETLDPTVRRVIELRAETAKSSTAKLNSMLAYACHDDRARGMLFYHGASTGRWSGRGPQPQNYPRPTVKDVEKFIPAVTHGTRYYDAIEARESVLLVISAMLRSMLRSGPGRRLMAADFSQIEARIVAWIAGQQDLLQLFASGGKVYEEMAADIYRVPVEEIENPSERRQVGKGTALGAGFGMGADTHAENTKKQTGIVLERGQRDEEGNLLPGEIDWAQRAIDAYRQKYRNVPRFWKEIEQAAMQAVLDPGTVTTCGHGATIKYTVRGNVLWCILPSGRPLAYCQPEVRERKTPWGEMRGAVTFLGVNSLTKKWQRHAGYGGLFTENVVQAMARDLMASAMLRAEAAGYPIILTVHDEIMAEVPNGEGSLDELLRLMMVRPEWAQGLPVAAEGWEGERYRK
jgi:DNA polymerase